VFSRFFIERPVFAAVLSIIILLAGAVSLKILPIAQYPEIAPPVVTVTANYPGASAQTLASTVASPIEEQLSGVENLLYYSSTSASNGQTEIQVTFEVGTDIDKATFDVNNRVQLATPRLPDEVRRQGVTVRKASNNFLLVMALNSPKSTYDQIYISNYATQNVVDDIKRVPGVADVFIFGARDYSMRLWLQPDKMARLGITTGDIRTAVNAQNAQFAAGKIGAEPSPKGQQIEYTVTTRGRLLDAEQFGDIVLRAGGPTGVLRIKDVARVELGAQSYDATNSINGQPAIAVAVFLASGANALQVGDAVKARMGELKSDRFPPDLDYSIPYDTTRFVSASIKEVMFTILDAAVIVLIVVFVFLQTWRATLIPMLAVPVSLIGTFAGLWLFGFSINTLTLFAMVLAIGIVVDDAIVVLENVERLIRTEKMTPMAAAIEAMHEVQGAVIGIVLALCAVFIPVAFLGGIAGQLYRQFAVTVTVAVVLSGVVALTLTPALCAVLLKPGDHDGEHWQARMFRPFNRTLGWVTEHFVGGVGFVLRNRLLALLGFVAIIAIASALLWRVPSSFVPPEDQGYIVAIAVLPDGATLERTTRTTEQLRHLMDGNKAVENFFSVNGFDFIGGGSKANSATMFLPMVPWEKRKQSSEQLTAEMSGKGFALNDGIAFAFNPPAIQGLSQAGGFEVFVQARNDPDPQRLAQVTGAFMGALQKRPEMGMVNTFFRPTVPQLQVEVDREKAMALGINVDDVFTALQAQMGSLYVNDFNKSGRTYRVTMQADAQFRAKPDDLGAIYVRSATSNQMIPLKALIRVDNVIGPEQLQRYNGFVAARILGNAKDGYSSGQAIRAVEETAKTLPPGYDMAWTGQAYQEKRTGNASLFAFGFAIVMVYLILSALYERWGVPFAVVLAVPFALTGALLFVWIRHMENDIYFQIGLVVLIGLAAKNAILIAEFAMQGMEAGKRAAEAARDAARLRFRPIVMTSLAFVFGVVPLVTATGAGAAARQSMGTGVFGGMIVATFIAPIFVPLFFTLLARKPRPHHEHLTAHAEPPAAPQTDTKGST